MPSEDEEWATEYPWAWAYNENEDPWQAVKREREYLQVRHFRFALVAVTSTLLSLPPCFALVDVTSGSVVVLVVTSAFSCCCRLFLFLLSLPL